MKEHDSIRWYIDAIKKDVRRLAPEQRLELAAESIDTFVELQLRKIMEKKKCSRKEAMRILRKRWFGDEF